MLELTAAPPVHLSAPLEVANNGPAANRAGDIDSIVTI